MSASYDNGAALKERGEESPSLSLLRYLVSTKLTNGSLKMHHGAHAKLIRQLRSATTTANI